MLGWNTLMSNWTTEHGNWARKPWKVGEKRTSKAILALCSSGYHFCDSLVDVIKQGYGNVVCRSEAPDESIRGYDKYVGSWRKLLAGADCGDILNEFAIVAIRKNLKLKGISDEVIDGIVASGSLNWEKLEKDLRGVGVYSGRVHELIFYARYQDGIYAARAALSLVDLDWAEKWLEERINARLALPALGLAH